MPPQLAMKEPWYLAFLDETSKTVTALTACFLMYTRSAGVAYFAAGGVLCSLTVKVVKRAIRQPRPEAHSTIRKPTYGMPSTHSATITYYAIYVPLACAYLPLHPSLPNNLISRVIPVFVVVPWAALIAVSRVWLGHHSWEQVAVGCSYGVGFAALWFALWTKGINHHGALLEQALNSYVSW